MRLLSLILCTLILVPFTAHAQEKMQADKAPSTPNISIENAYSFATMPGGMTGAAFMIIKNTGDKDDMLIEAKSNLAKRTEIHENTIDPKTGKMMMRKIKGVDIPANGNATLKPQGYHVMFISLKDPLTLDTEFPLTLIFKESGEKTITVKIIQPGTMPNKKAHDHSLMKQHEENILDETAIENDKFPTKSFPETNSALEDTLKKTSKEIPKETLEKALKESDSEILQEKTIDEIKHF